MDDPLIVLLPCPYLFGHELFRTDGDSFVFYLFHWKSTVCHEGIAFNVITQIGKSLMPRWLAFTE